MNLFINKNISQSASLEIQGNYLGTNFVLLKRLLFGFWEFISWNSLNEVSLGVEEPLFWLYALIAVTVEFAEKIQGLFYTSDTEWYGAFWSQWVLWEWDERWAEEGWHKQLERRIYLWEAGSLN